MGMDVYGLKPTTEHGEYFRNNVWWWHPLWDYCIDVWPELADKVPGGHSNSGDGLDAIESRKLGFMLENNIKSGQAEKYIKDYNEFISKLESDPCHCTFKLKVEFSIFSEETITPKNPETISNIDELLEKVFSPEQPEYIDNGTPKKDPDPECKYCSGSGKTANFATNYSINIKNIKSFSKFLLECGGFRIC